MAFPLRTGILALLVVVAAPPATVAQQGTIPRAFELERRGNYEAAADAYRQVLGNLMDNAYHYTPENGTIIIHIHSLNGGGEVQVDVKDNGVGISLEDQDRIFERFYRGENSMVLSTPGTGLGLSIVKQIVEMHKGRIWMKSTGVPGEGSTFSFTLPVYETQ